MKRRLILAALTMAATPAAAQVPGVNVAIAPRIGVYAPLGNLMETSTSEFKIKSGLGLGLSVELDLPLSPINVRANLDATVGRDVEEDGVKVGDVDVVNLTGDLVFRPIPRVVAQPYLLAGAGIKRYSSGFGAGDGNSTSDFTGHVGAGIDGKLGPLGFMAEVSDYISSFSSNGDSKLQNDMFIMAGLRIGLL
jgi:hypothetical protein